MAQISHLVRVRSSLEDVFARVATTDGIAEWFTRASSPDYRTGGTLELHFPDGRVSFEVTQLVASSRIAWRCTTPDNPWFGTDIVFEFTGEPEYTLVRFDHLGWPEVTDRFRDCSMSWAYFLESLRSLIEDGKGTPEGTAPACEAS